MVYNNIPPYDNKLVRLFYGYGWSQVIQYQDLTKIAFNKLITDEDKGYRYNITVFINRIPDDDKNAIRVDILTDLYKIIFSTQFKLSFDMLNDDNFVHMINTWITVSFNKYINECRHGTVDIYPGTSNIETREYSYPTITSTEPYKCDHLFINQTMA